MFSYFTWKKSFCSRKWWGEWGLVPPCPPFSAILLTDVYNAKIKNIEEKIPDITNSATNTSLNAKTN